MKTKYYTATELAATIAILSGLLTMALCCAGGVWKWVSWCFG